MGPCMIYIFPSRRESATTEKHLSQDSFPPFPSDLSACVETLGASNFFYIMPVSCSSSADDHHRTKTLRRSYCFISRGKRCGEVSEGFPQSTAATQGQVSHYHPLEILRKESLVQCSGLDMRGITHKIPLEQPVLRWGKRTNNAS
ncbi:Hypothetical protein NTJ_07472 [Nesidiocoris tenuis]|uniref:Uncharacterized protein n=1 Tax=Nesidiocoris tenuis TaxID=355587 RepID=A0ABN7AR18_9HEMI|nr:Hypothetical protein NTJ_07472 [Nesidiocoris tenuis]